MSKISPDGLQSPLLTRAIFFHGSGEGRQSHPATSPTLTTPHRYGVLTARKSIFLQQPRGFNGYFSINATGGTPVRLTTNSGSETPIAFLNDHEILFFDLRHALEGVFTPPFLNQTWKLDISEAEIAPAALPPRFRWELQACRNQAKCSIRTRRVSRTWRKHERSSGTSDIWLYDNGRFTQLTKFNGHDLNSVWKADGNSFFFISEEDGTLNVYEANRRRQKQETADQSLAQTPGAPPFRRRQRHTRVLMGR